MYMTLWEIIWGLSVCVCIHVCVWRPEKKTWATSHILIIQAELFPVKDDMFGFTIFSIDELA